MSAIIASVALHAPARIVENSFFDEYYKRDMSRFLIEQRNISRRHFMSPDEATSDLIVPAARAALEKARLHVRDLDLIIVATDTPDYISPSTASVVQHKLEAKKSGTFDLNSACAGFVSALDVACKYIVADQRYHNILVVGAYGMSKFFDWNDFKVTSVFADGAGAAIVQRSSDETLGQLSSHLYTDGQYHDYMGIYSGGTAFPITPETVSARRHLLQFVKRIPPETNGEHWPQLTRLILDRANERLENVKSFFFTQINIASIRETMSKLGLKQELAHNIMDRFGYTGSACIPMALADAAEAHKLKRGDLICLLGSGGGMSIAAMTLRWAYDT